MKGVNEKYVNTIIYCLSLIEINLVILYLPKDFINILPLE